MLLLIHGITGTSEQWNDAFPLLAEHYTVVAPDLLGHGESAKPRGDYSLGAYAVMIRDLMIALGHHRVTVVGHSLGGGLPCSSPTSTRSSPSGWWWSRAGGWDARCIPSCGRPPSPERSWCCR